MFVDASALTAMLLSETDAQELLARLSNGTPRQTSPLAVWETSLAVARVLRLSPSEARQAVEQFLALIQIDVIAVAPDTQALAVEAFERYGKGRHPAALNFGDCFAYACARHAKLPLLYKGNDFPQTDIEAA
jgi:ribonuclease VapC